MKKIIAILMLISVLAIALTACGTEKDVYQNDVELGNQDVSLDNLITDDVSSDDLGGEDFIEIGDMI